MKSSFRILLTLALAMACGATAVAGKRHPKATSAKTQKAQADIAANVNLSGSNYLAYPGPSKVLTAAPAGYEPFYISHYGRHGSRFLIGRGDYDDPYRILTRADSAGALTPLGKDVLRRVIVMRDEAQGRLGELSPLGAVQHRQIAHRMVERFPQVFSDSVHVEARSTVVIRCILSMENALQEIARMRPTVSIFHDASQHDMYYMNDDANPTWTRRRDTPAARDSLGAFNRRHPIPSRLAGKLFSDKAYAAKVDTVKLCRRLFDLARALQNVESRNDFTLWDIFTPEEAYAYWLRDNASWYTYYGPCAGNCGDGMHTQDNLVRNIVATADSCIQLAHPGATLRYAHETDVLPLTCLMNINGFGDTRQSLESLADTWQCYRIFPMGCNVQMVFYRSTAGAPILVKVLLNEDEATLPLEPVSGPYYRWTDVRSYLLSRLAQP